MTFKKESDRKKRLVEQNETLEKLVLGHQTELAVRLPEYAYVKN